MSAGTGGCLGAAFESQRRSSPGQTWKADLGEPMQPGVPARQQRRAAGARSARAAAHARQSLGKVPLAERQQCSPAAAGGKREARREGAVRGARCGCGGAASMLSARTRRVAAGLAAAQAGLAARSGAGAAAGRECPCLCRGAPPSRAAAGADTCARVRLERDPREDGLGDLPSPTPPGLGARHLAARGAQGVPPGILGKGSGCGPTALPLTCGAAADARSPLSTRGRQKG